MDLGYISRRQIWLKSISSPFVAARLVAIGRMHTIFAFNDLVLGMLHGRVQGMGLYGLVKSEVVALRISVHIQRQRVQGAVQV